MKAIDITSGYLPGHDEWKKNTHSDREKRTEGEKKKNKKKGKTKKKAKNKK